MEYALVQLFLCPVTYDLGDILYIISHVISFCMQFPVTAVLIMELRFVHTGLIVHGTKYTLYNFEA